MESVDGINSMPLNTKNKLLQYLPIWKKQERKRERELWLKSKHHLWVRQPIILIINLSKFTSVIHWYTHAYSLRTITFIFILFPFFGVVDIPGKFSCLILHLTVRAIWNLPFPFDFDSHLLALKIREKLLQMLKLSQYKSWPLTHSLRSPKIQNTLARTQNCNGKFYDYVSFTLRSPKKIICPDIWWIWFVRSFARSFVHKESKLKH